MCYQFEHKLPDGTIIYYPLKIFKYKDYIEPSPNSLEEALEQYFNNKQKITTQQSIEDKIYYYTTSTLSNTIIKLYYTAQ